MRYASFRRSYIFWFLTVWLILSVVGPASAATKLKTLHAFQGGTADGGYAYGPLVIDKRGDLYGITEDGGSTNCGGYGCGVAFKLTPGTGPWKEKVFYALAPNAEGYASQNSAMIADNKGNFFGTDAYNDGDVYELSEAGGVWTQNIIHTFTNSPDGQGPNGGLVRDSSGNLYGVTTNGGANGSGAVFQLSPSSGGAWTESIIYSFNDSNYGPSVAYGPLAIDASGNLYGTTVEGGTYGWGTAYKLSSSSGTWEETTLYNFTLNYSAYVNPQGVVFDTEGNLYGVTLYDGEYGLGTIYKLTPTQGFWNKTVLHTFTGGSDGGNPYGGITIDSAGNLYGPSYAGGTYGYGTIYKFVPSGSGGIFSVMYTFRGGNDGKNPAFPLTLDSSGNLYGVSYGGAYNYGTVFEITP